MMKRIVFVTAIILMACITANGQNLLRSLGQRAKNAVENKITEKVDKAVYKAMDKAGEEVSENVRTDKNARTDKKARNAEDAVETGNAVNENPVAAPQAPVNQAQTGYAKTDFVPGDEIFFDDPVEGEKLGEFPSRWDFLSGEQCEVATLNGEQVIKLSGWYTQIVPLMKEADYLPDVFTVEFDVWSNATYGSSNNDWIRFELYSEEYSDGIVHVDLNPAFNEIPFEANHADMVYTFYSPSGNYGDGLSKGELLDPLITANSWLHVAVSFNKRAFKYYVNGVRLVNLPNVMRPTRMRLVSISNCDEQDRFFIKNIRMAKGAVPLYDRLASDGKIVTYAITFETGKADLKPESMIEIGRIAKLMKENLGLEFEVQGHCDSTGSDKVNDPLSQKRAEAIVEALVAQDIARERLTPVGKGSHSPVASNSTDEGRAKNRRVEFVKK